MHIQQRRRDSSLAQHHIDLTSMVRLVIEEVPHGNRRQLNIKFALVIHVLERTRQERNVPAFEKGFYPRIFLDSSPSQGGKLLEKDRSQGRRVAASSLEPCHPDTVSHQNVI